jgi:Protein of unknown function (DUF3592)
MSSVPSVVRSRSNDRARRAWPIFAIFFLIGVVSSIYVVRQGVRDYRVFHVYEPAQCTVIAKRVITSTSSAGSGRRNARTTSIPELTFQHRLNGTLYTTVGYDNTGGRMASAADLVLYDVGKAYPCWYDPAYPEDAVLARRFRPVFYVAALIPLAFLLIGGNFLWLALGPKPAITITDAGRGEVLAVRLAPEVSRGAALGCLTVLLVVWSVGLLALALWAVRASRLDDFAFYLLLAAAAEAGLVRFTMSAARAMKVPDPIVEIDHEPVGRGQKLQVSIRQRGPARFDLFRVSLLCERQDQGGTAKEHGKVILLKKDLDIDQVTPLECVVDASIGSDTPPSDRTVQSRTTWKIVVKRAKKGILGLDREYVFRVV